LRLVHGARLRWWRLSKHEVRGTNVMAFDPQGRLLLVRHSYHQRDIWMLPGGGLRKGEEPVQTGARELAEETGCILQDAQWLASMLNEMESGWNNRIELITGTTHDQPRADGRELDDAAFFALDRLPQNISPRLPKYIAAWRHRNGLER
jgi:8-oxo-dGTP pyrophosphatase MutT (NUDIX family)